MKDFERVTANICMQKDVGINGNLFGGNMLSWVDCACAIFAREQTCEKFVVTMMFGEMVFKHPVREGDIVSFWCGEVHKGRTSISFAVKAMVDNDEVFSTSCTFVAVDRDGKKKEINWKYVDVHKHVEDVIME